MKIAQDKTKHFFVGIPLGIAVQGFLIWLMPSHLYLNIFLTIPVLFAGCYAFELYSRFSGKGHYEVMDAVAGTLGGIVGMAITLMIELG